MSAAIVDGFSGTVAALICAGGGIGDGGSGGPRRTPSESEEWVSR